MENMMEESGRLSGRATEKPEAGGTIQSKESPMVREAGQLSKKQRAGETGQLTDKPAERAAACSGERPGGNGKEELTAVQHAVLEPRERPLRFIVIGSGWRSLFYARIAQALPQYFELGALLCRSTEKADRLRQEAGVPAVCDEAEARAVCPDFVVVAVDKASIYAVSRYWMALGYPVLCETPAGVDREALSALWALYKSGEGRLQVAEQYFCYPSWESRIRLARSGRLGELENLTLSYAHDYHAASLIRRLLDVRGERCRIQGSLLPVRTTQTGSRYGVSREGRLREGARARLSLAFESGKTAFYDFDGEQYHSTIRRRYMLLQGTRGELSERDCCWLGEDNLARQAELRISELAGRFGMETLEVSLDGEVLYTPPFGVCGLPEDETAIARLMYGFYDFISEGKALYPLAEGLEDAYISILMHEALEQPGRLIESEAMPWQEALCACTIAP